jgi:hypothetical protein
MSNVAYRHGRRLLLALPDVTFVSVGRFLADPESIRSLPNAHCLCKKTYEWERVVIVIAETIWKLTDQRLNDKRLAAQQSVSILCPKNSPQ